jgi:hypothetical protein
VIDKYWADTGIFKAASSLLQALNEADVQESPWLGINGVQGKI